MRKIAISIVISVLLLLCSTPVLANGIPTLPHAFYGSVTVNGAPASNDTQVSAIVDSGSVITNAQNPVATVGGSYGINSPYLLVQGDISPEATVTFYVNGVKAEGVTAIFEAGGGPTEKNLSVTIAAPSPGAGPTYYYIQTSLFGVLESYRISYSGELQETIEVTSDDGMLTLTIPEETLALDEDGNRLETLEVTINETPPDPPEDAHIIGLAYDFGPDGATFDPAITLTFSYDPEALPEGVAEEDLVLAYYDEDTGEWVELPCVVDTVNNIITASVPHFTTFAIIGSVTPVPPGEEEEEEEEEVITVTPAAFSVSYLSVSPRLEVEPGETVTITVLVANTGGESGSYTVVLKIDGVKEAEETVTIAAGESQGVSFSVTREEADSYAVTVDGLSGSFTVVALEGEEEEEEVPTKPGINWPLIGGIIGGVIVVGLGVFFWIRRRAY